MPFVVSGGLLPSLAVRVCDRARSVLRSLPTNVAPCAGCVGEPDRHLSRHWTGAGGPPGSAARQTLDHDAPCTNAGGLQGGVR